MLSNLFQISDLKKFYVEQLYANSTSTAPQRLSILKNIAEMWRCPVFTYTYDEKLSTSITMIINKICSTLKENQNSHRTKNRPTATKIKSSFLMCVPFIMHTAHGMLYGFVDIAEQ